MKCFKHFKMFYLFLIEIIARRHMILELVKLDFKSKYLGSYLGILWAFLHPTCYILILWFVFHFGFKSQPAGSVPFVLWMLAGIVPWFFFSESLPAATTSVLDNYFLVKKISFSVGILPIVKLLSGLVLHFFFVFIIMIMLSLYGFHLSVYYLQVFYYLFACIVLLLGLSWLTSSIILFFRDMGQLVSMILQFAFWATPIFWSAKILPPKYANFIKLNPLYYIVEGYRECFIYPVWFWRAHPVLTIYYWSVTGVILVFGAVIFRRLRPHFADVL